MSFQTVPIQITGSSYQSRSKPLSSQQTVNWYPQYSDEGKENLVLMPFPGLKQAGDFDTPMVNRGFWRMSEVLYQVKGNKLYSIDRYGEHTELGDLPNSDACDFADDGINMFIVTGGVVYHYSSTLKTLTRTLTDYNGIKSVDFIQSFFIYGGVKFLYVSKVGDGTVIQGTVGAEFKPDALVKLFVYGETIYAMGDRTVEAFYINAAASPPTSRLAGQVFNVGLKSRDSVASTDNYFYFLGDDYSIYQSNAGVAQKISTDAISNFLQSANDISSAVGYTFTLQGQNFYCINVGGKSFILNESLGIKGWFELSSGLVGGVWQGGDVIDCYGKNMVADTTNGKVYELDLDTYKNDGDPLKRTRVTRSINGDVFNMKGKRIQMSRLELIMETGVGLITGQGENPRIMIEISCDGGRTFKAGSWARVGRMGEHVIKVEFFSLLSFYDAMFKITTTDPVNYTIFSGTIDLRVAGR